jgi:two-component system, cell cycle response regulator
MDDKRLNVLLVEDDPDDVLLIQETLAEVDSILKVNIHAEETLEAGIDRLMKGDIDVVLLDLSLPDSQGLDTFMRIHAQANAVPIIILTGLNDENFALEAVRQGAQDYLVKGNVNAKMLARVIRYGIERNRTQAELRSLSLVDELTGLYNRRGFMTFADQYLKLAQRKNKGMLLVFADLDNLKQINDTFGHHEGDLALIRTAKTLRETFRKSDIIARIGGDEFPIMAMEAEKETAEKITEHLQENLKKYNNQSNSRYQLSLSIGTAYFDPEDAYSSVEDLMQKADEALYAQKRDKKKNILN